MKETRRKRYHELRRLGVSERTAFAVILSPKGPWRLSSTEALHRPASVVWVCHPSHCW